MSAIESIQKKFNKNPNACSVMIDLDEWLAVVAEAEQLKQALVDDATSKTMLTDMAIRNGGIELHTEGGMCGVLANSFAEMLRSASAPNYLEMSFESGSRPEIGKIVVTVQRCEGITPHQFRMKAEEEAEQLRVALEMHDAIESKTNAENEQLRAERDALANKAYDDGWKDAFASITKRLNDLFYYSAASQVVALANQIEGGES